ncbi:hypothetical protein C8R44DRAFT_856213 [Mycena epipterygia]|nr:hypothetical protein C8R44DRAFT_856213 [Mycena epipterygia]
MMTMGRGDDAEYVYDPSHGFSADAQALIYPPPDQPSLEFAQHQLAVINEKYPEFPASISPPPRSAIPFGDAINLPHGPIPSMQARADAKRLGDSIHQPKPKQRTGEDVHLEEDDDGSGKRVAFRGRDLLQLARAVVDKQPFLAKHKEVAREWKAVNAYLVANGFRHRVKHTTIQRKAKALVAFKKDPTCEDAQSVASQLQGDVAILIGAVLEQLEKQWDDANTSEEEKQKIKQLTRGAQKIEADRAAGEVIRNASLSGRKRPRSPSPDAVNDADVTDTEGPTPKKSSSAGTLSTSSSIDLSTAETSGKTSKRRRMDRRTDSTSATADIVKLLEKDIAQRHEYQQEQATTMKAFLQDQKESRGQIIGLLENILRKDSS